ncbi:MAG: LptF/LptG family permease [Candidatus Omnitrophota bacterium]|jgi:lipopolysaccharide export system permease protein
MRILDRYILKSIVGLFVTCLFTFLLLYVIIDIFSHLEDILKNRVGIMLLAQYYLSYLPIIFVQVTPIACLLSVIYTFGKLNRDNEIIAMRASGLSILQISKTALILGIMLSALVFLANDRLVPSALSSNEKLKQEIESGSKKNTAAETINNLSMYGLKNRLFFINRFSPATNTMEGITILEQDEHQNLTQKIVANRAAYKDGLWRFYQTVSYEFDENGQIKQEPQYMQEEIMAIPETPRDFLSQRQRPEYMDIEQLQSYLWRLSKSGASGIIKNLKVDLYQRYTAPLTVFIIMLLGIPFSLRMKKRATGLSSIGLSLMVGFLYYVLNAIGIALGKAGILFPLAAVSISHIAAFGFAVYLIAKLP